MLYENLLELLKSPEDLMDQLIDWGIVPPIHEIMCIECGSAVSLRIRNRKTGFSFLVRCRVCKSEYSLFKNGFFTFNNNKTSRIKLPISNVLKLIYHYFDKKSYSEICQLAGIKSLSTVVDWANYVREVTHNNINDEMIGGDGITVQIDEALMRGRIKNNKGLYFLGDVFGYDPTSNSKKNR